MLYIVFQYELDIVSRYLDNSDTMSLQCDPLTWTCLIEDDYSHFFIKTKLRTILSNIIQSKSNEQYERKYNQLALSVIVHVKEGS